MAKIYISYSRIDAPFAKKLTNDLRKLGHDVWIDDSITGGTDWWNESISLILRSNIFIVLVSSSSSSSEWVSREIEIALHAPTRIIPILIGDSEIPRSIRAIQFLDARNYTPETLTQLIYAIEAIEDVQPKSSFAPIPSVLSRQAKSVLSWRLIGALVGIFSLIILSIYLVGTNFDDDTPSQETRTTETITFTPTITETLTPTKRVTVSATVMDIQGQVEATLTAISEASTEIAASNPPSPIPTATFNVEQQINATIVAIRATEENVLSPAEAGELAALTLTQSRRDDRALFFLLGILSLMVSMTLILLFIPMTRTMRLFQARTAHPSQEKPEPLLEEYQVFVSSSEKDKEWVKTLVRDLGELGFLVWWYAKDAPGLPFGKEIQSAIYYTKVFLIVISPDAMVSQHIEEEIRWAEIHKRPIVSILYRPTPVEKYLYGLAKGAGIDFTNEREYKGSMEDLTQAINHHLKKRLETVSSESEEES